MDKRRGGLSFLFLIVLLASFAVAYDFDVSNVSFPENQIYGETLSGDFLLSLSDAPINLVFYSEIGEAVLKDVLINQSISMGCEEFDCSPSYVALEPGLPVASFVANKKGVSYGLLLTGEDVEFSDLDFKMSASFDESNVTPIGFKIGNSFEWEFKKMSEDFSKLRQITYGCFNSSVVLSEGIIDSSGYCEQVNLTGSMAYFIGANISGSGVKDFIFSLTENGEEIGACTKSVTSARYNQSVGCTINFSEKKSGVFDVCIKTESENSDKYKIRKETSGKNCGKYSSYSDRNADYSLFVMVPYYAEFSGEIELDEDFSESVKNSIDEYIYTVFNNDCSNGCTIPITFFGDNLDISLYNIKLGYSSLTGPEESKKIYSLIEDPYRTSLSENILIESFGWPIDFYGNKTLSFYLKGDGAVNKLFSQNISVKSVPIVNGVFPRDAPAGMEIYFYASVSGEFDKLIWNFGDGSTPIETNISFAKHKYSNISNAYFINITAFQNDSNATKSFNISTISPEDYINQSISIKKSKLNQSIYDIELLPSTYKNFVKNKMGIPAIQQALLDIEIERTRAASSNDFLEIINKINLLDVPDYFLLDEQRNGSIDFGFSDSVDPSIVAKIVDKSYSSPKNYMNQIFAWQFKNIVSSIEKKKISCVTEHGIKTELLTFYDLTMRSGYKDDAYFIVQESISNLNLESSGIMSSVSGASASYTQISPGQTKNIKFFVEGYKDLTFFVSPSLDDFFAEIEISLCKIDGVCNKDGGENYENCPNDCKNYKIIFLIIAVVLFFVLIIYTLLQYWYVVSYEKNLFKSRHIVFNLLAFINNAKINGKDKDSICSTLSSQGWSKEQITYVYKKSEGKNTGMLEILPIQKWVAHQEMKKAQSRKQENIAPPVRNLNMQNDFPPKGPTGMPGNNFNNQRK